MIWCFRLWDAATASKEHMQRWWDTPGRTRTPPHGAITSPWYHSAITPTSTGRETGRHGRLPEPSLALADFGEENESAQMSPQGLCADVGFKRRLGSTEL